MALKISNIKTDPRNWGWYGGCLRVWETDTERSTVNISQNLEKLYTKSIFYCT